MNAIWIFLGGGIGSLMRYGVSLLIQKIPALQFPVATLISNATASLLVGVFTVLAFKAKFMEPSGFHALFILGICGGFSTFSTFANENLDLFQKGYSALALLNIVVSIALCIGAVYLGRKMI
jgi:CrcB protein